MSYEMKLPLRVLTVLGLFAMLMALAAPAHSANIDAASCRVSIDSKSCNKNGCRVFTVWGSGTLIAPGRVLTCSHLFDEGGSNVTVYFLGNPYPAKLLKRDPKADLALLSVGNVGVRSTGYTDVLSRSCVFVYNGYGGGQYKSSSATFDRWTPLHNGRHSFYLNGVNRNGDSGGGVFDSNGLLVGVMWGCGDKVCVTAGEPLVTFLWGK